MVIIEEKNSFEFDRLLLNFFEKYSSSCESFVSYFESYYCKRPELWALCYRNFTHANVETNMYAESYHSMLKQRMNRNRNFRMVDLIVLLEELEYERWIKLTGRGMRGEPPVGYLTKLSLNLHKIGMKIPEDSITKVGDLKWNIIEKVNDKKVFIFVEKLAEKCNLQDHLI
jgi:hypothetical protein